MNEKWYAVYTKPRWEKKVADILTSKKIENYCPTTRIERQWSDRIKVVYQPFFSSYVFVRITEKQFGELKKVNGVLSLVLWLGKPAVIKNWEVEAIKEFLHEYSEIKLERVTVNIADKIKVTKGPLLEKEGSVVALKNNTVKVVLPSLGYVMYANLKKTSVEKVKA